MFSTKPYDVIIVGSGVTGLAAAYFLRSFGIKRIAIVTGGKSDSASIQSAGMVSGGQFDNYTRVSHAHGDDFARELWAFGHRAFDELIAFARNHGIAHTVARRVRLVNDPHELVESRKAVQQMQSAGFTTALYERGAFPPHFAAGVAPGVLAIQDEGPRGGWLSVPQLLAGIRGNVGADFVEREVVGLEVDSHGVLALLKEGELSGQMAVLACHQQIGRFIPALKDAIVTFADQWSTVSCAMPPAWSLGTAFSIFHGYIWGTIVAGGFQIGGGRQLRKLAGIGYETAPFEQKISNYLVKQLTSTFQLSAPPGEAVRGGVGLDIRPCDELPIIGPMFGEERVLLATGYMGQGLVQGFYAGKCLAELIAHGACINLPRRLWPERLRSL